MPVRFYLYSIPNKVGEHPIRISISVGQARYMTGIGYNCSKDAWDDGFGVKARYYNSKGISSKTMNAMMNDLKAYFAKYEVELVSQPSPKELKKQYLIAIGKASAKTPAKGVSSKTIFDCIDEFVDEESIACQWAYATVQCWTTFKHHLEAFSKKITFMDFDEEGINRFIYFLRAKRGLEEKTVQKQYNNLKWFLNWAIRKGYCKEETINKYKPKFKVLTKPVIFLTKDELIQLYHFQIPDNGTVVTLKDMYGNTYEKTVREAGALEKTRDLFCFCAFTSLRYSDMANLKRTDIKEDCIYITTQKTNDSIPINLNSFSKAILEKYDLEVFPKGLALPVISNQKMNKYLKDLCELCGFNEPITITCYRAGKRVEETFPKWSLIGTHAGRRTFICFALSSGIPPQIVMKWTGHSDYKAMKPYIDIAESTKAKAMSLFDMELSK